jgi:cytochrome c553
MKIRTSVALFALVNLVATAPTAIAQASLTIRLQKMKMMKIFSALLIFPLASALAAVTPAQSEEGPPAWTYPVNPQDFKPSPDDGTRRRVPGSSAAFTLTQLRDLFFAPDWHPGDHPPMPQIVSQGRKPDVFACGVCHRADGPGGPENSSLAGLSAAYIVQQMADFKSGARNTSVPERVPPRLMISLSKAATDAEVEAAAAYFSALKPKSIVRVVETDTVPKTYVINWHLAAMKSGEKEPIGQRIIEVPEDLEQFVSRDSRTRFIAYAPVGSIEKGQALAVTGGGGKTVQCGICHGPDLKGLGPIPGIAGRSPSYIVRQLYDFKHGARAGMGSGLMKPSVEKLTTEDMVSLAAYAASLTP